MIWRLSDVFRGDFLIYMVFFSYLLHQVPTQTTKPDIYSYKENEGDLLCCGWNGGYTVEFMKHHWVRLRS